MAGAMKIYVPLHDTVITIWGPASSILGITILNYGYVQTLKICAHSLTTKDPLYRDRSALFSNPKPHCATNKRILWLSNRLVDTCI